MTAIATLIPNHLKGLSRYALALTRDPVDADDLLGEVVVRALDNEASFQPGTNLRAWLFTMEHNLFINGKGRERHKRTLASVLQLQPQTGMHGAESSIELRQIRAAIARLNETARQVLLLIAIEGLKYEEVASLLHLPLGTVRSSLFRTRAKLRHEFGRGTLESFDAKYRAPRRKTKFPKQVDIQYCILHLVSVMKGSEGEIALYRAK